MFLYTNSIRRSTSVEGVRDFQSVPPDQHYPSTRLRVRVRVRIRVLIFLPERVSRGGEVCRACIALLAALVARGGVVWRAMGADLGPGTRVSFAAWVACEEPRLAWEQGGY